MVKQSLKKINFSMDYYFSEEGNGKNVGQSHTNRMTDVPCPHKTPGIIFGPMQLTWRLGAFLERRYGLGTVNITIR